ncbi:efflux RND transporter permease subunit [Rhodospirillum centenum]|uniref:AcrB n=1 Tax=Rhodospirillum centenum (strain ATCC 51521 / SW) TaxID=414684 RepID=B6IWD2_RHOCS|nr:efflux RND transporter permease subunit [Rhodospirillum centenum]ACJ00606.1 AcrB [Rhodospirillum centenum SW]
MVLSDVSIQRPVLAFVLSAVLVVFGLLGYDSLPVRELPRIDPPIVSIDTSYPGASAEVVDNEITERIESVVNGIEGIRTIRSRSREGNSSVSIEFELTRDIDGAANDVRDRVSRVVDNLPEEADPPEVTKVDSDSQPIMWITLTSDRMNQLELTDYVRRYYLDTLNTVPGVASIRISGRRDFAMRVWLDRDAMAARGVTVRDVETAIRRENTELPAGRIESSQREFTVRTDTRLSTPGQFAAIVVRQDGANLVRIGDVARVEVGPRDDRGDFRLNGIQAVGMGIQRQSTANTVEVSQAVHAVLNQFRASLPPGMTLEVRQDDAVFINQSIYEVFHAIGVAILLVVLVVWVFLRTVRATVIPVVAIPVSLVAAFGVLALLGYSINVLTLLAFVLAVGLVVDDAIIVVENAARRIEEGEPPLLASFRGARQIGFAVIATTLVLLAVIFPLTMLDNEQGRLLREFAVALMAAVGFSCAVALTLSPMLCSKLLRVHDEGNRFFTATEKVFTGMADLYGRALRAALGAPVVVLTLFAATVGGLVVTYQSLESELAPQEDRGVFRISVQTPEGATLDFTDREVKAVEGLLEPYLANGDVNSILTILAPGWGGAGVNRAMLVVRTPPWDERSRSVDEIVAELMPKLSRVPGARVYPQIPSGLGLRGGGSNQIQFVLRGNTYEELAEWRDAIIARLQEYGTISSLVADYDETKPQLRVQVDRDRASDLGVGISDIGSTLETMMAERQVTRYLDRGEEYDVVLRAEASQRSNPRDLSNIYIRGSKTDQLVPLANLIEINDIAGATELNRYDRLRSITISGTLEPGLSMGEAIDMVRAAATEMLPPEAQLAFEGAARQQLEASSSIFFAFGMALLVAFLVLAAQFENFRMPLIIILAVPLALFGGVLAMAVTGMTDNIYTQIGLILLVGLICKNAILIVEFANQLRDEGLVMREAVIEASKLRLRPILMTSIATVFGALPLALAEGAGAESRMAIGWVIVGGVTIGTLLSLFVTPLLYNLAAQGVQPVGAIRRRLQDLDSQYAEHGPATGQEPRGGHGAAAE